DIPFRLAASLCLLPGGCDLHIGDDPVPPRIGGHDAQATHSGRKLRGTEAVCEIEAVMTGMAPAVLEGTRGVDPVIALAWKLPAGIQHRLRKNDGARAV